MIFGFVLAKAFKALGFAWDQQASACDSEKTEYSLPASLHFGQLSFFPWMYTEWKLPMAEKVNCLPKHSCVSSTVQRTELLLERSCQPEAAFLSSLKSPWVLRWLVLINGMWPRDVSLPDKEVETCCLPLLLSSSACDEALGKGWATGGRDPRSLTHYKEES